jgi:hypothetical protein
MHGILPLMLGRRGGGEWLSEDLISRSSGWRSDKCGRSRRNGSGVDLCSDESKLLRKRNPKEGGEWKRQRIMMLPMPFIGWRREGRWYHGGETIYDE